MIQVFKQREDGTFDFTDSLVVHEDEIPKGYALPDRDKHYREDGRVMTEEELETNRLIMAMKPTTEEVADAKLQVKIVDTLLEVGVL